MSSARTGRVGTGSWTRCRSPAQGTNSIGTNSAQRAASETCSRPVAKRRCEPIPSKVALSIEGTCHGGGSGMTLGPSRGIAVGGVTFGIIVLFIGTLIFLNELKILLIPLTFATVCALGLVIVGIAAIIGSVWARGFVRRGWKQWMTEDWD